LVREKFVIPGASYYLLETDRGPAAGIGFRYQLSNRIYIDAGGTLKYLLADVSKIWFTSTLGMTYRIQ